MLLRIMTKVIGYCWADEAGYVGKLLKTL